MTDSARLVDLIRAFRGRRVLALSDLVVDEFINGRVERVSREAPVLILKYDGTDARLGGGANAVHNIKTLGGAPIPVGVVGKDAPGQALRASLRAKRIDTRFVFSERGYLTPVKTRILGGGAHQAKQQIVRIDKATALESAAARRRALRVLQGFSGPLDAVLVSDYGFGLISKELVRAAIALAHRRKVPVTVDTRHGLLGFRGMTAVTPNEPEVEAALGITIGSDLVKLEAAGQTLLERLGARAVLITRGSDGMALFEKKRPPMHIPIFGSDQVTDVTGAGDTVIATFTLALAAGASPAEASRLANFAGGVVVMKQGTATVSAAELQDAVRSPSSRA